MREFKHVTTGEVLKLNASHSALSVVENSPSWEEVVETEEAPEVEEVTETEEAPEKVPEEAPEAKPKTNKKK